MVKSVIYLIDYSNLYKKVNMIGNSAILSVKDLNQMVKDLLTDSIGKIWLIGEISNFSKPASGHWYFKLKDDSAQIQCAMFRNSNLRTGFIPQNGQQVLVSASVTIYEARGEYQLVVDKLQLAGAGLLQQRFEQLKQKLQQEGLFDVIHKQPIPKNIQRVGIVTSSTGAALHDICQILKRRDPNLAIIIYPSLVQGDGAASQIAKMIELANLRQECDVLIVGRGGGSLEDLWPFNEEIVARAIFASQLPIISAVGHEIDFTIADFVADLRAATPSAAAELISRDRQDQIKDLKVLEQHLAMAIDHVLLKKNQCLQSLRHHLQTQHPQVKLVKQQANLLALHRSVYTAIRHAILEKSQNLQKLRHHLQMQHPQVKLVKQQTHLQALSRSLHTTAEQIVINNRQQLNNLINAHERLSPEHQINLYQHNLQQKQQQLITGLRLQLQKAKNDFAIQASQLNTVSPLATLERGYSITSDQHGKAINSIDNLNTGDTITTNLKSGKIISTINTIEKP